MTVSELIHILQQYPADRRVLLDPVTNGGEMFQADIGKIAGYRCERQSEIGLWESTTGALEPGKIEDCVVLGWWPYEAVRPANRL